VAYSLFDSDYGVPGHEHHEGGEIEEEEGVVIDMRQRRFDVKGELSNLGFFNNVRLRVGANDYQHRELEGAEVGTEFNNDTLEARVDATHRPFGALRGSIGVQWLNSDFVAAGEEAFLAPNETSSRAIFAFEELTAGRWDFQFGARYESQDLRVEGIDADRSFGGVSGSLGTIVRLVDGLAIAASLARAVRLPNATELFANGPHAATSQFEVGNPSLNEETALGIDVSLRKTAGRFRGVLNVFQNYFDGYIFEAPTGEERDELPVFAYQQADARFRGIEIDTHTELWHAGEQHIELEAGADLVNATLENGGGNLPRIPPVRASLGLRYEGGPFNAWAEARRYFDQEDVAAYEEPTAGYTMVNAAIGYRFFLSNTVHDVMLRGTNLTDELARVHTSPLKERAPLPGRDWQVSYRVTF
jgi:iron complex outermembrane receptor protein